MNYFTFMQRNLVDYPSEFDTGVEDFECPFKVDDYSAMTRITFSLIGEESFNALFKDCLRNASDSISFVQTFISCFRKHDVTDRFENISCDMRGRGGEGSVNAAVDILCWRILNTKENNVFFNIVNQNWDKLKSSTS